MFIYDLEFLELFGCARIIKLILVRCYSVISHRIFSIEQDDRKIGRLTIEVGRLIP